MRRPYLRSEVSPPLLGLTVALVSTAWACGGEPHPKVREIESIATTETETHLSRVELEYEGDQLTTVYFTTDGELSMLAHIHYRDDQVKTVEIFDADNEPLMSYQLTYTGDNLLEKIRETDETDRTYQRRFSYHHGHVEEIEHTETVTDPITAEVLTTNWTEGYDYDKQDRVERISVEGTGEPLVETLEWNEEQNTLSSITSKQGDQTWNQSFEYDDDKRLERVGTTASGWYGLTFDGDRLSEVTHTADEGLVVSRYFFDKGDIAGVVPSPAIPRQVFFNIEGHLVDELNFVNFALLLEETP